MGVRPYGVVAHEAAHVVVGVALGLRLRSAVVRAWASDGALGWAWFPDAGNYADAIATAAGIAWERAVGGVLDAGDRAELRRAVGPCKRDYEACVTAAAAILETRSRAHALVIRALIEHDLTGVDVARLARGENPSRLREDDAA